MDDLPVALGDALRVKGRSGRNPPGDRKGRDADTVWPQICPEYRRRRPEGRFAEGDGRQGRDWMIGETAAGDDDGAEAGGSHGRRGDLCDDDGANDVDRIGLL